MIWCPLSRYRSGKCRLLFFLGVLKGGISYCSSFIFLFDIYMHHRVWRCNEISLSLSLTHIINIMIIIQSDENRNWISVVSGYWNRVAIHNPGRLQLHSIEYLCMRLVDRPEHLKHNISSILEPISISSPSPLCLLSSPLLGACIHATKSTQLRGCWRHAANPRCLQDCHHTDLRSTWYHQSGKRQGKEGSSSRTNQWSMSIAVPSRHPTLF